MKPLLSLFLSLVLMLSLGAQAFAAGVSPSLANFTKLNEYVSGQFLDFPADIWYAANIKTAYELGLMKGSSASAFNPTGALTIAETLALACRIHSIYYANGAAFTQGSPWYQVYIDYATNNGIVVPAREATSNATRAEFAAILASSLPATEFTSINTITSGSLPDVPDSHANARAIYMLYCAGILTGNDADGTYTPDAAIDRAAAATIATRIVDTTLRKAFTLNASTNVLTTVTFDKILEQFQFAATKESDAMKAVLNATKKYLESTDSSAMYLNNAFRYYREAGELYTSVLESCNKYEKLVTLIPNITFLRDFTLKMGSHLDFSGLDTKEILEYLSGYANVTDEALDKRGELIMMINAITDDLLASIK